MDKFSSAFDRVLAVCGLIAAFTIAWLAVMISADVILRNLKITNFPWLLEVAEYALFVSTFLAAPWVLSLGSHVRVDVLVQSLPDGMAQLMERAVNLAGAVMSLILAWYGFRVTTDSFTNGDLIYKELVVPEWILLIVIPISGVLLTIEFARRFMSNPQTPDDGSGQQVTEGF